MDRTKIFNSEQELLDFLEDKPLQNKIIEQRDVCFARNKNGIYAFENKCPHYSVPLTTGNLNYMGEVVCSLHAYRFNLQDGWETTGKKLCLKKFQLEIEEDGVFITL